MKYYFYKFYTFLPSKRVFPPLSTGSKSSQSICECSDPGAHRARATEAACSSAEGVWRGMGAQAQVGSRGSAPGRGLGGGAPGNFSGFTYSRLQEIITEFRKLLIMTDRDVCITLLKHEVVSLFQICFGKSLHINN